ncbi:2-iminoacetate synthase [Porphyridium purpureum]|uniref:2-iminoacetate synthase n=1 Tax=Porphyridium purpureum TaxID=35688 RepID=A0A5J4YN19_PORPP|nr:2-iminoacetate synthase [Porphyridium purpureum]|eukprot:POR3854..scf249_10
MAAMTMSAVVGSAVGAAGMVTSGGGMGFAAGCAMGVMRMVGMARYGRRARWDDVPRRGAKWSVEKEPQHVFKSPRDIVREAEIHEALFVTKENAKDAVLVKDLLQKAEDHALLKVGTSGAPVPPQSGSEYVQGLTVLEAATLLNVDSANKLLMQLLFDTAFRIKERIYGNRIVLFAPLYVGSYCVNQCTYCSFRASNHAAPRGTLSNDQLVREVEALQRQGHRRLLLVAGESPKYSFEQTLEALQIVSQVRTEPCGGIRRINVEIPTLSVSDFRRLKATNCVGTYTLFHETYHRETYRRVHPAGPKSDYDYRLLTMDRAQTAGVDDVGIGALFGLYDYRFEVLGMLQHAQHLDQTYGAGPHTVSIPRIQPALGAPDSLNGGPNPVSDADFMKLVAVLRCAVPYTGMILSTRENPQTRKMLLHLGVSQMSAGSKTDVGSYSKEDKKANVLPEKCQEESQDMLAQFTLQDHRAMDEIVHDLMEDGFVPSWCTACYRKGRTGEAFMKIAKKGDIHNYCHPNGLLTLQEYLIDYASERTRALGEKVVQQESETIGSERAKQAYERKLKRINAGEHDLYF